MTEEVDKNKKEQEAMSVQESRKAMITNPMQIALVKLFYPEIQGGLEYNTALAKFVVPHARNFRQIINIDSELNPDKRLTDLWAEDRGKDSHKVLPFIKGVLEEMMVIDDLIASVRDEKEKEALGITRKEKVESLLRERSGIL